MPVRQSRSLNCTRPTCVTSASVFFVAHEAFTQGPPANSAGSVLKGLGLTFHHVWTMLEGRGFTGCGKTSQYCHSEEPAGDEESVVA